jgi:hypothetical protein
MKYFRDGYKKLKQLLIRQTWIPDQKYVPPCLWSKGISQYCDFRGPDSYWREETESCQSESFFRRYYEGASGLVWVRLSTISRDGKTCDLDNFVRGALPTIRKPFALITTDGDASVPSDIAESTVTALLGCRWLVSWHTQNYDGHVHARLVPLPMGIDLHTPRLGSSPSRIIAQLKHVRERRLALDQAPLRVLCDLGISISSGERRRAIAALRTCSHVDFLEKRLSQYAIWRRYAEYPFVLSAAGNGLDCHRTWELLYLGNIVITKTSSLDRLYDGLPVAVVRDWNEVGDERNLAKWLQQYGRLTGMETVWSRLDPNRLIMSIREALPKL